MTVAGLLERAPAGVQQAAEHRRPRGHRGVVAGLRSEVLSEVRLVVDRPEVDRRQRRARPRRGEVPAVARADRLHELPESCRVRPPGEERVVLRRIAALGPPRGTAGDREVDRQAVDTRLPHDRVVRGPIGGRIGARVSRVETWLLLRVRAWSKLRPGDHDPHRVGSQLAELCQRGRRVRQIGVVLEDRDL